MKEYRTFALAAGVLLLTFIGIMAGKFEPSMFEWALGIVVPTVGLRSAAHAIATTKKKD